MAELVREEIVMAGSPQPVRVVEVPVYRAWHVAVGGCAVLVALTAFLVLDSYMYRKMVNEVKTEVQKIRDDVKVKKFEIDKDWLLLRKRQNDLREIVMSMGGKFVEARLNDEKKKADKVQKGN